MIACVLLTQTWRQGMLEDLRKAPEGSILLLHACAHNPTGAPRSRPSVNARRLFTWPHCVLRTTLRVHRIGCACRGSAAKLHVVSAVQ